MNQKQLSSYFPADIPLKIHTSPISDTILLYQRVFFAVYFTGSQLYRFYDPYHTAIYHFLHSTSFWMLFTHLYYILVIQDKLFGHLFKKSLQKYIVIIFQMTLPAIIIITISYWNDDSWGYVNLTLIDFLLDLNVHGFPVLALTMQFFLNSYSYSMRRYYFFLIFSNINCGLQIAYSLLCKQIYVNLNFQTINSYILCFFVDVTTLLFYRFGNFVYHSWKEKKLQKVIAEKKISEEEQGEVKSGKDQGK